MKKISILFVSFLVLASLSVVSAHVGEDNYSHHGMMGDMYGMMTGSYGYGYGGMIFGWLIGLLVIVVLVLLIVWLIKQIQKK